MMFILGQGLLESAGGSCTHQISHSLSTTTTTAVLLQKRLLAELDAGFGWLGGAGTRDLVKSQRQRLVSRVIQHHTPSSTME